MSDSEDSDFRPDSDNELSEDESWVESLDSDESSDSDRDSEEIEEQRAAEPWCRVYPPENVGDGGEGGDDDVHLFQELTGPKHMPPRESEPLSFFLLFLTVELLTLFVTETNRYARQFIDRAGGTLKRRSSVHKWVPTCLREMKAFIAIIINMGLNKKPTIAAYWSTRDSQHIPWFGKVMARESFELLLKFFHMVNNETLARAGDDGYDPCGKFSPLIAHTNRLFRHHYIPQQELSVDESLVGTKNRTQILQYLPNKHHHKWGIKLWMLCEAVTGYVLGFFVYRGKRDQAQDQDQDQKGLAYRVVTKLLAIGNYLGKGYHVFVDNFFSSVELARDLFQQRTYLTGTIRRNRKDLPKAVKTAKLQPNTTLYYRRQEVLTAAYREKKSQRNPVLLLSTKEKAEQVPVTVRTRRNDPDPPERLKPKMVLQYNKFMGGVDVSDQMLYVYLDERRTLKFWRKMVFSIIGRMTVNAYILYKQHTSHTKPMTRFKFTSLIVESLVKEHMDFKYPKPSAAQPKGYCDIPDKKEKDCNVCSNRSQPGGRKRSRTMCVTCSRGVHHYCFPKHQCKRV